VIEKLTNRIEYIKDIAYETSPNIEMIVKKINELVDVANIPEIKNKKFAKSMYDIWHKGEYKKNESK